MDYAFLRKEGIAALEQMTGGQWTDFNPHDPGITILEQLCYGLTDLSYRASYDISDLLADGGGDPYKDLHLPPEILTCNPVTPADLRRMLLDIEGVKNAWVLPITADDKVTLYYHSDKNELDLSSEPEPAELVKLKGLYRVLVAAKDSVNNPIMPSVIRCLHQHRGICEDFAIIEPLTPQPIQVDATVDIGQTEDAYPILVDILDRLAEAVSPTVPFRTLDEMLQAGKSVEELFEGPLLQHGFILDEDLESARRRTAVNTSDLIRAIMDVPGVRAVSRLYISSGSKPQAWSLEIGASSIAELSRERSTITLRRDGKIIALPPTAPNSTSTAAGAAESGALGIAPPSGRDRSVSEYYSIQHHFPAIYGVGELGLARSESPSRKGRAKQLKAYLMFFDQIMADYLAQLAHIKDLFSYDGDELGTYFTQVIRDPSLGLDAIRSSEQDHEDLLRTFVQDLEAREPPLARKHRFLNHLLARFAETLDHHITSAPSLATPGGQDDPTPEDLVHRKQAYLRDYPKLSGARGTAFNYLKDVGPGNRSGLEERVRLKLGLSDDTEMIIIEHILLRPILEDDNQETPLLASALKPDPYSFQLTFVFPDSVAPFTDDRFKALVEQTIREETPAHLTPYVSFMADAAFATLKQAHATWLVERRAHVAAKLGINLEELG